MKKIVLLLILFFVQVSFSQNIEEPLKNTDIPNENHVYNQAYIEKQPEYPGGIDKFREMIGKNFRTPRDRNFKGGKIFAQFIVEKDGSLSDIRVLKHPGFGTDEETIRVIKKSKRWKPAEQQGKLVRCSYMLPIIIQP